MKDYKSMYLDLVEEISCKYEDFIYKNMQHIINDDVDACKLDDAIISVLNSLLYHVNVLNLRYDDDIQERLGHNNENS